MLSGLSLHFNVYDAAGVDDLHQLGGVFPSAFSSMSCTDDRVSRDISGLKARHYRHQQNRNRFVYYAFIFDTKSSATLIFESGYARFSNVPMLTF